MIFALLYNFANIFSMYAEVIFSSAVFVLKEVAIWLG